MTTVNMLSLFLRQFAALFWKNWIILSKHKLLNLLRCLLLPIGYGGMFSLPLPVTLLISSTVFLAVAQGFLEKPNNVRSLTFKVPFLTSLQYGMGTPAPIYNFTAQFDGSLALIWADGTNGTGNPSAEAIMAHITSGFDEYQLGAVTQVANPADIPSHCPQNFKLTSQCYAAIAFNHLPVSPTDTTPINYTISADGGLIYVNVYSHTSDFETRILPLQLAIDEAFIALRAGESIPTPLEWPYTQETNEQQSTDMRLSYIRGIRTLLVIALFFCYVGIAYQLPGAFAGERANLLTGHMKAMGLLDSARITSWHLSFCLAYLPAWIVVALTWHYQIFTKTNGGLVLVVHLLLGFSLASWSFFVSAPFGKSPQLAAVVTTFLSILFAILALVFSRAGTVAATIFTLIFPPGYYIFAIRSICGYENHLMPTNLLKPDPDDHLTLLPIMIASIIDIFLWPYLGALLERRLYDAKEPSTGFWSCFRGKREELPPHPDGVAISIKNLRKAYTSSIFSHEKGPVTAVADLSLDIPNAGKSTSLSIIANLIGRSSGSITFEGGVKRPARGTLGIVPQKNVLFPDLTCYQTLRLLRDCDLGKKIHSNANTLSGGQKRKLQLAIGLIGGSKIVLVDECTSGVDPLSRRALWRTLTSVRHDRTIVFTTHFLDEADLLADHIAILAAPGKLVAEGSPVALKTNLGHGYSVQVTFDTKDGDEKDPANTSLEVLDQHPIAVEKVLQLLDNEAGEYDIVSVDVLGTSIEDIFLDLMESESRAHTPDGGEKSMHSTASTSAPTVPDPLRALSSPSPLILTDGRARSPFSQTLTIFYKRMLIARRSWLTPLLTVLIAVCGACIPLVFLSNGTPSCAVHFRNETVIPLYWPDSPIGFADAGPAASILESPPNITATLGHSAAFVLAQNVPDNATFVSTIQQDYLNIPIGGISVDMATGDTLFAWDATATPGMTGLTMLNLVTNILYNRALNSSGDTAGTPSIIMANYASFPPVAAGTLVDLKWIAFFGATIAVYPAFFSLYVSRERRSSVQAMQLSNGLSDPIGLWLGHLLWDSLFGVIIATIIIIVFATTVSNQFYGLGLFWVVLVQYGIVGALFSYCASLVMSSPLTSFAAVAGYQIVMYALYLAAYLLTLTYAPTSQATNIITTIHFTLSVLSPVASVLRAAFVDDICLGRHPAVRRAYLYLFVYGFVLLGILVWVDSGSVIPRRFLNTRKQQVRLDENLAANEISRQDVAREAKAVAQSSDALRVLHVTKSYDGNRVVDDVSFGVPGDVIFAMLGPNGAGKTTTFNMIRGDVVPDTGDVKIKGISVVNSPRSARLALGVCPQFTAIDVQLTVREHLLIYGRLKGLKRGSELNTNVESLMVATSLHMYADRLASQLSGGNQRKLALAIALIGNPSVVLIDEFSTGIDAKMKRDMWGTLRNVAVGKAIVITTHSMEEASALANKVGIISKRMLAIGTTEELAARYATYQVHFSCPTREDVTRAQVLMSRIPGARLADDVATRFEVPIRQSGRGDHHAHGEGTDDGDMSLARLFHVLSSQGDFQQYTVEKATLENVFLKVIRQNNVLEEDTAHRRRRFRFW
ncbi:P-loop containing nucleoside triphosphate hydrolase protein [Chiua virens]|nr:P-loop containing nucleoside triphosphate hydrolase protein [Chiua virens]